MQLDPVRLLRHLVGHEAHRQPAVELGVQEIGQAIADQRRVVVERMPQRVEVLAPWVRASEIGSAWSEVLL